MIVVLSPDVIESSMLSELVVVCSCHVVKLPAVEGF